MGRGLNRVQCDSSPGSSSIRYTLIEKVSDKVLGIVWYDWCGITVPWLKLSKLWEIVGQSIGIICSTNKSFVIPSSTYTGLHYSNHGLESMDRWLSLLQSCRTIAVNLRQSSYAFTYNICVSMFENLGSRWDSLHGCTYCTAINKFSVLCCYQYIATIWPMYVFVMNLCAWLGRYIIILIEYQSCSELRKLWFIVANAIIQHFSISAN